jgi:hypothetical protein
MTQARTFLLVLLLAIPARAAELKTLKGETVKGDVVSITAKELVLDTGGGKKVTTAVDQILTLTFIDPVPPLGNDVKFILVELTDGSQLKCAKLDMKGKDANLILLDGQKVGVPIANINYVVNEAHDPAHVKALKDKVQARKSARDILAMKRGEVINAIEGTLGDVDDKGQIEFLPKDGAEKSSIPISRPVAIYFRRGAMAAPPVLCRLHDTSKNLIFVSELKREADGYTVVTSAGATIKYANALVARLDFSGGKLVYLSTMATLSVKETSTEGNVQHYRKDENLEGGKIRLAGIEYTHGLSLHSTTELEYELDGEFRELKGVIGIDDDIGGVDEPAILKIFGDNVELISWAVSRKDKNRARTLNVNVKDVKRLRILVTSDDILDLGKHVTLADIRVSK